ncbi:MAG: hypothetical protein ACKVZH_20490 [Blastocatellia bacterium]
MKNFAKLMLLIAVLFSAGALAVSGAAFLILFLTASQVGGDVPMVYFDKLNLSWLTILLPLAGIVAILAALPGILSKRKAGEETNTISFAAKNLSSEANRHQLKAA